MDAVKLTYSVSEAAQAIGLGRNSTYEAIARGEIPAVRIGKRILVPRIALEQMLSGNQSQHIEGQ